MEMTPAPAIGQWMVEVREASQVAEARRRSAPMARRAGLDETQSGALALIVTELATNLVKHAQRGQILVRVLDDAEGAGVEVISVDHGPGMADVQDCFRDGVSSAGTRGTGLGAVRRQADELDIYSRDAGTVLVARVRAAPGSAPARDTQVGTVCLPIHGESQSGDAWDVLSDGALTRVLVVDGLGHGVYAAEAAAAAVSAFRERPTLPVMRVMEDLHEVLRSTRGAVAAIAELDAGRRQVRFVGVGNIGAALWLPERQQNLVSMNGTLGHVAARMREFTYPWAEGALLVVHSDGLQSRWSLDGYPGLAARDPSLVAAVLYRDFSRGRDDVAVAVVRSGAR